MEWGCGYRKHAAERLTLLREQALSEIEAFLNVTQVATKLLNLACESGQFLDPGVTLHKGATLDGAREGTYRVRVILPDRYRITSGSAHIRA